MNPLTMTGPARVLHLFSIMSFEHTRRQLTKASSTLTVAGKTYLLVIHTWTIAATSTFSKVPGRSSTCLLTFPYCTTRAHDTLISAPGGL